MENRFNRRGFMKCAGAMAAGAVLCGRDAKGGAMANLDFKMSLAGWSLHRTIGTQAGKVPMLDMPKLAREEFGIGAIELVNRMLASEDKSYLDQFAKNAAQHDVKILLIMIDGEGDIGHQAEAKREEAVKNHKRWIDIAAGFGCHSVRMNWRGHSEDVMEKPDELAAFINRSAPALGALCEYGDKKNINVLIENHGGPSSYPEAMLKLIKTVDHPRFGTLPDFGNFPDDVDRYAAVDAMMPYAKAVSAKCYDFDPKTGLETLIDYGRMLDIVVNKHHYHGHIGIEFERDAMGEFDGIRAAKKLLEMFKA